LGTVDDLLSLTAPMPRGARIHHGVEAALLRDLYGHRA
jgi:hypothetical protein